jgi:hypothetical protein
MLRRLLILVQIFMLVVQPRFCTCMAAHCCDANHEIRESECGCCEGEHDIAPNEAQSVAPSHSHQEHKSTCLAMAPRIELKPSESSISIDSFAMAAAVDGPFESVSADHGLPLADESPPRSSIPLYLSLCAILV